VPKPSTTTHRNKALKLVHKATTAGVSKAKYTFHTEVDLPEVLRILETTYQEHPLGDITSGNAFRTLVGCIISLRTKDEVTIPACEKLFAVADDPATMAALPLEKLEQLIYPAGFYKTKAVTIHDCCIKLLEDFQGRVPHTIEELLTFKGVGRKTANLVMGLGHHLPAICVDIHVHRICNRLGAVTSMVPDDTEFALREGLPLKYWEKINWLMVIHGRETCKPIGARCDICPVLHLCQQHSVKKRQPPKHDIK
jgi:endonuclease III